MRKIIAITYVTLDGVMQSPGGSDEDRSEGFEYGGWLFAYGDEVMHQHLDAIMSGPFDLLLGRKTYDIFAGYWPGKGDHPIGAKFNAAVKYVATHRTEPLAWENAERIEGASLAEGIAKLKAGEGPDIHLWGSGQVVQELTAVGLIDEYRVWIFPLVLGTGKRWFERLDAARGLRLVETKTTTRGVLINTYVPGEVILPGAYEEMGAGE